MKKTCIAALAATIALAGFSTPALSEDLTLGRVFASPSLSGPTPRQTKLSPDGRFASLLRNRPDDQARYDLWAIDSITGEAKMLVDSLKIGSGGEISEVEKMQRERARVGGTRGIVKYDWAPDGRSILVPLDGDIFLASLDGNIRQITNTKATETDAQVSQTGRYVSFVRDQNFYVMDIASGKEQQLTRDGGGVISWGSPEFVAQEEMHRYIGHWWANGDRYIAVERVDESPVKLVTRTSIGADGARAYEQRYPFAGTPNAIVDLYIMAPDGSGQVKVDLGTNPDQYVARVNWSVDGKTLYVQRESRDQKRLDLLAVDPATGRSTLLFSELSDSWINLHDNLWPLKDGSLLWSSERSGFSHLYRWKNGKWIQLTRGDWEVGTIKGYDEKTGRVFFSAMLDSPDESHLYWVDINRPKAPVRVTESGWHNAVSMDKGATRALVTRSNPDQPPQVLLTDAGGRRIAWVEENRLDASHPYAPYLDSHEKTVFGMLKAADGVTDIPYKMISPKREPGKRYPVFVEVYAGPSGGEVLHTWTSMVHQYLVDKGWIVFSVDGRGTARRGRVFANALYHKLGTPEVEDQLAGLDWLKSQDYVDPGRIGLYGWSYGGFMALKLLAARPNAYTATVIGAPVARWELYDTHYSERFLGNPAIDPKPYEQSNPLPYTDKLAGPMLIMHGMSDDNVVFDNTTALISKLQQNNQPFEFMAYPGAAHSAPVMGGPVSRHIWMTIENFLDRTVKMKTP